MILKKCEASDCTKIARTNSAQYCEMHYMRERRHGDITQVRNHSKTEYKLANGYKLQTKEIFVHLQNIAESIRGLNILSNSHLHQFIKRELGLVSRSLVRKYANCILDNSKYVKDGKSKIDIQLFCTLFDNNKDIT